MNFYEKIEEIIAVLEKAKQLHRDGMDTELTLSDALNLLDTLLFEL